MYTVLSFKATRGFKILVRDVTWDTALRELDVWYRTSKTFFDHGLMPSGVAVMIATVEDADELALGYRIPFQHKILYQAGSY